MVDQTQARLWFRFGCLFEGLLAVVALVVGRAVNLPLVDGFHWRSRDAAWGLAATLPLLALLAWMRQTRRRWTQEILNFLDHTVQPVFGPRSLLQIALISVLAGLGEELLFRGLLQGALSRLLGAVPGLLLASVLFGAFHCATRGYAVLAALIGAYLGLLWICTGNLLVPVITHASYDFLALVYFLRIRPRTAARML